MLNFPDLVILGKNISGLDFTGNLIVANTSVNLTGELKELRR